MEVDLSHMSFCSGSLMIDTRMAGLGGGSRGRSVESTGLAG